ncbi:glycoside hydrolase family 3 N-terminal domain-containing protein [uncultured Acetobacteroides sp.]|uniref:glycoside hydrolase family 3 N-terminal domain-containing protein n=1 Tax=uncultured Acetobacteroides sp. TaxID=1760811 RepID=UPI0029F58BBF|nr:glycoside hydrolase family 3 N-terminal domain-containing protein [uncultured Acetobacteroides sp.]
MDRFFFRTCSFLLISTIVFAFFVEIEPAGAKIKYKQSVSTREQWVDSVFSQLTTRQKIGQLMMVAAFSRKDLQNVEEVESLIKNYGIGGVIFMRGGPVAQAKLTNRYQNLSKIPLMVGIDGEWGLSMRLDSIRGFSRQMLLGAFKNDSLIYEMGKEVARECKLLRVNVNFAPSVDINSNPLNPIINVRSFGENRDLVSQKGIAYMRGMQDHGLIACAKHFPGHGETEVDSHRALPFLGLSRQRLDSIELYPFRKLVNAGVQGIMVGHLSVPALEPNLDNPTSISRKVVTDLLKKEIGFKGLVFSDALNMKGISASRSPEKVCSDALRAGNDILLFPEDVPASIRKIEWEIFWGRIDEKEVDEKVRRVLGVKFDLGLTGYYPIDVNNNLVKDLNSTNAEGLRESMVASAMTVISNKDDILPLMRLDTLSIAVLNVGEDMENTFTNTMAQYCKIRQFDIQRNAGQVAFDSLGNVLKPYNLVIVGYHDTDARAEKNYGVDSVCAAFIGRLATEKKCILNYFGSPYGIGLFPNLDNFYSITVGYESSVQSEKCMAEVLFGGRKATGFLPVSINPEFKQGRGIQLDSVIRIRMGTPEEFGINRTSFADVEELVNKAISIQTIPGCQVLAMKDGVIFYYKAFGSKTYNGDDTVSTTDMYDIASVTKVSATLPVLMKLSDNKFLDVDRKIGDYLPELKNTNKFDITCREILVHQSGLSSGISMYPKYLRSVFKGKPLYSATISDDYPFKTEDGKYQNRSYYLDNALFGTEYSEKHQLQVASSIYVSKSIKDSILVDITGSRVSGRGEYHYSDLGFYYFQRIIENCYHKSLDRVVDSLFFRKLGMNSTMYNPTDKVSLANIVPTEVDYTFRNQLLRGFVHDPGAALMGGVAGHAGVFSNAIDLAKLMQLYLNKGVYGGDRYFSDSTFNLFNTPQFSNNRRALGFDKPEPDSKKESPVGKEALRLSFGHTGYTGTMVWADPTRKFVYIFLSNRVYPSSQGSKLSELNTRTDILTKFLHMIDDKSSTKHKD